MGGNEWANSSDAAIQLHPLSFISIWLPCGLSCWFSGFNSTSWRVLSSQVMTSLSSIHQSAFNLRDRRWQLTIWYSSRNLLLSPFIHARIQIEKFRDAQSHTNQITHSSSLSPSLPHTQTHSSTISSQRDCTHSNKQRRRLLSECNYLVLSISLTAGGQRALCWWG